MHENNILKKSHLKLINDESIYLIKSSILYNYIILQ